MARFVSIDGNLWVSLPSDMSAVVGDTVSDTRAYPVRSNMNRRTATFIGTTVLLVFATLVAGCFSLFPSPRSIRSSLLNSFLYYSADCFYPTGHVEEPGEFADITRTQRWWLQLQLSGYLEPLLDESRSNAASIQAALSAPVNTRVRPRVRLTTSHSTSAHIDPDGNIVVDVGLLEALLRTSLVADYKDPTIGRRDAEQPNNAGELEIVNDFLRRKARIAKGVSPCGAGAVTDENGNVNCRDSEAAELLQIGGNDWHYVGPIRFMLAHELGHVLLGDLQYMQDDCTSDGFKQRELRADAFAALVLGGSTRQNTLTDLIPFLSLLGAPSSTDAWFDFFVYTYDLARFNRLTSCNYPTPQERLRAPRPRIQEAK